MTDQPPAVLPYLIETLKSQLREAQNYPNPYQARYTVDAISSITKGIIRMVRDDERLAPYQAAIDDLVTTGQAVSKAVPRICPECNDPHQGSGPLCNTCQRESQEQAP